MRALLYPAFEKLEVRDLPTPTPAPGELLMRVSACGICGSELEAFKSRSPRRTPPLVMGHEFCGTIIAAAEGDDEKQVGRRVVSNSVVSCAECPSCRRGDSHLCTKRQVFGMNRPGAFAEYIAVPRETLLPWPDELPAEAACLAEPLANGVHIVNLTRHLPVHRAVVLGAGPIGLMCQQALRALREVEVLTCDLSPGRLAVAHKLGATKTVCSKQADAQEQIMAWTSGEGVDLVIDAVGAVATKRLSLSALRPGGAAVWIGLQQDRVELDTFQITLPERQIFGTYAAKQSEVQQALDLMVQKKVDVATWTEKGGIETSADAFFRMLRPGDDDLKAVVTF